MTSPELLAEFRARTPGSAKAHQRALDALPGGQTRTITHYPPYPVAITTGAGASARITAAVCGDGTRFLFTVLSLYR